MKYIFSCDYLKLYKFFYLFYVFLLMIVRVNAQEDLLIRNRTVNPCHGKEFIQSIGYQDDIFVENEKVKSEMGSELKCEVRAKFKKNDCFIGFKKKFSNFYLFMREEESFKQENFEYILLLEYLSREFSDEGTLSTITWNYNYSTENKSFFNVKFYDPYVGLKLQGKNVDYYIQKRSEVCAYGKLTENNFNTSMKKLIGVNSNQ